MTPREKAFTRFMRSRIMALLSLAAALVMMVRAQWSGAARCATADYGVAFPSPNLWFAPEGAASRLLSLCLVVMAGFMMIYLNRRFNLLRTLSVYFAGLFFIMMGSMPPVSAVFAGAVVLTPVVLWCMSLLYTCYDRPDLTRRVFLVFCLLSAGALAQYGFLFYIPVFTVGLAQMRILKSPRVIVAALLGLVTPPWIAWGLGLARWRVPAFDFSAVLALFQSPLFIPVVVTLSVGVLVGGFNMVKIMAYNAHSRANNGLLSAVWLGTLVFALADCGNLLFYMGTLCCSVAFQMGHFFRLFKKRRAYIFALALLVFYIAVYFA